MHCSWYEEEKRKNRKRKESCPSFLFIISSLLNAFKKTYFPSKHYFTFRSLWTLLHFSLLISTLVCLPQIVTIPDSQPPLPLSCMRPEKLKAALDKFCWFGEGENWRKWLSTELPTFDFQLQWSFYFRKLFFFLFIFFSFFLLLLFLFYPQILFTYKHFPPTHNSDNL